MAADFRLFRVKETGRKIDGRKMKDEKIGH